jgi:thiamine-phosphate pyrophosphorylase
LVADGIQVGWDSFVLIYYITDRTQFAGNEAERRAQLLQTIRKAAAAGVDYIQLREKDLCGRELELLARETLQIIRAEGSSRLLINHRTDVALAVGADGVHLRGTDIAASDARALACGGPRAGQFLVAASCHSAQEVRLADAHGADFAVLAPIFEKVSVAREGIGLQELRRAAHKDRSPDLRVEAGDTRRSFPVFALGGVELKRARLCAAAGATGIAGIRLIQQCLDLPALVRSVRSL